MTSIFTPTFPITMPRRLKNSLAESTVGYWRSLSIIRRSLGSNKSIWKGFLPKNGSMYAITWNQKSVRHVRYLIQVICQEKSTSVWCLRLNTCFEMCSTRIVVGNSTHSSPIQRLQKTKPSIFWVVFTPGIRKVQFFTRFFEKSILLDHFIRSDFVCFIGTFFSKADLYHLDDLSYYYWMGHDSSYSYSSFLFCGYSHRSHF